MMNFMKRLLSLILIFVLAFSMPVQAAAKKVTAVKYEDGKKNYPTIKTGTYKVTVNCGTESERCCIKFKAPKAGTYKFTLKSSTSIRLTSLYFWKGEISGDLENPDKYLAAEDESEIPGSIKFKLKKGDTIYISMLMAGWTDYSDGDLKLGIKKVK